MVSGIRFVNGALSEKFLPGGTEDVEARRLASVIMNCLARVRGLLLPDKYATCIKNATAEQVLEVRRLQRSVNSVHMLAIQDAERSHTAAVSDSLEGSPGSVQSLLVELAGLTSGSPARTRSAAPSSAGSPCCLSSLLRDLQDASTRGANRRPRVGCTSYQSRGDLYL